MGNIGDSISDSAPAVGAAGPGYATTINSLLTELKARLVAKVPLSSLLTNSNLNLNSQALLNAAYITLVNEGVSPIASPSNRIAAYAGNLWWVSPSGAVQLTNGNTLNAAGVGGITGDYSGAGPMEFRYDTANTRYDAFANQSSNTWAYVRARGFDIAGGATSAFRLRQLYNGTSNTQLTWSEVPTSTVLTVDGSGVITGLDAIRRETQVYYDGNLKNVSAIDLYTRGYFTGGGAGSLASTDDVFRYNFSDATGKVTIPLEFDTEGATAQTVPIQIDAITWFGDTPGGAPTIELWRVQHDNVGNVAMTTDALQAQYVTCTPSLTTGTVDKAVYALSAPLTFKGDEVVYMRVTAGTNNSNTYHITVQYTKIA